jgi:hypothetical protein
MGTGLRRARADGTLVRRAVTALVEADLLDAWTTARHADRSALIDLLGRLAFGGRAATTPWDVATRQLLVIAAARGRAEVVTDCPTCATQVEATVPVEQLVQAHDERSTGNRPANGPARPPAVADMVAAAALAPDEAADEIARRCGLDVLDDDVLAATLARWDDEHVLLAPSLATTCPACGTEVELAIDAVALAWATVGDLATAVLDDVTALARGFGWTETEVLAVPPARRRMYRDQLEGMGANG